ncbi:hypothetical protein [Aggregatibacter actinomycetemcomitans]|nr:hypothetical protein [Aggregatibacter actinomycetemcomitans]UXM98301.1 hypothetical protein N7761_04020 [Aggregatibacter actinomycetemcomitans]
MQKTYRFCAIFILLGLLSACSSSWPEDLKGTLFEPVNKTMQTPGDHKK